MQLSSDFNTSPNRREPCCNSLKNGPLLGIRCLQPAYNRTKPHERKLDTSHYSRTLKTAVELQLKHHRSVDVQSLRFGASACRRKRMPATHWSVLPVRRNVWDASERWHLGSRLDDGFKPRGWHTRAFIWYSWTTASTCHNRLDQI